MTSAPPPERVADLFESLVELDPAEAELRLGRACDGDRMLEAAVRTLLAHDRQVGLDFLAPVAAAALAHGRAADAKSVPSLSVSSRLGRYHVLHKLGEGGMGSVYLGYDEGLDRRVALKVVHPGTTTRDWLLREGQALGRLAHPHVVAIHEVGEQDGVVFLAMELVEGPTLRQWLEGKPHSFTEILRLFLQAGRGLSAAHRAGLVHRDFKPENVLVGPDGRARVVDFGLAALSRRTEDETSWPPLVDGLPPNHLERPLTQAGAFFGTPTFMAPEQFGGARATPQSDQWSFCVALYRAVYGASPFPSDDVHSLAQRVRTESPAPPPRRTDVPPWLWPILTQGLARAPESRFASMEALLRAVESHVPRDPNFDPTVMVRERGILTAFFASIYLVHSLLLVDPAWAIALLRPVALITVPGIALVVALLLIGFHWRQLARNEYGRQLAFLTAAFPAAVLAHRLIALQMGLSGGQILVEDATLFSFGYASIARGEHRWLGWVAALAGLTSVAGALGLDRSGAMVGVGCLVTLGAFGLRVYLDRHLHPDSALGLIDREDPPQPQR